MWIVTREINEYEQDGAYFVSAFKNKPEFKDLKKLLPRKTDAVIGRLLTRGGGRHLNEHEWFYLQEVRDGQHINELEE